MKAGLEIGKEEEVEIIVTKDMCPDFEGRTVHDLYATSHLVHHMEWAARKTIVNYLEPHEEAMGQHVDVQHLKPTLTGMRVRIKATVAEILNNKIVCDVEAYNDLGKIAKGYITQALIEKSWLERKTKEMTLIYQLSQEAGAKTSI